MKPTIQVRLSVDGARIVRPGARYAVTRHGDEYRGAWVLEGQSPAAGANEVFTEAEARLLLPLLRSRWATRKHGAEPTTNDGRLIVEACEKLGLTAADLANRLGVHESIISRARHGTLPVARRDALRALLSEDRKLRTACAKETP